MAKAIAPVQWLERRKSLRLKVLLIGALAQLGERLICIQEVRSSILLGSTKVGSVAQVVRAHA